MNDLIVQAMQGLATAPLVLAFLDAALKGTLLLAVAGLLCGLGCRWSAAIRHLIWSLALVGLLVLPILSLALPRWNVPVLPQPVSRPIVEVTPVRTGAAVDPTAVPSVPDAPRISTGPQPVLAPPELAATPVAAASVHTIPSPRVARPSWRPDWPAVLVLIWLIGVSLALLRLALGTVRVWRVTRQAETLTSGPWTATQHELSQRVRLPRRVKLLLAGEGHVPMTWGLLRPVVLLPSDTEAWTGERRRVALLHELAHVERWDYLTQTLGWLACALHWTNPLAWFALYRMRIERERACDDRVLANGLKATTYAEHLLAIARTLDGLRPAGVAAVAMARRSGLETRIRAVLDAMQSRRGLRRRDLGIGLSIAVALVLPLSAVRATKGAEAAKSRPRPTMAEIVKARHRAGTLGLSVRAPTLAEWQTAGVTGLPRGVAVSSVRNGPGKEAGIAVGDVITRVGDTRVASVAHFRALVTAMRPESIVELEVVQEGDALPTWAEVADVGSTEREGAFMAGEVLLPNGEPAAGAMVCAKISHDSGWDEQHPPSLTDSRGRFVSATRRRNRAGRCCLLAWRYDGHAGQAVVDFPMKRPAEIRLRKVSPIDGRLVTDNGEGVADVLIRLKELRAPGVDGKFEPWDEVRTGEAGRFALPPLPARSKVALEFTVPGYAPSPTEPYDLAQLKQGIILGKGGIAREARIAGVVVAADSNAPLGPLTLAVEGLRQKIKVGVDGRFAAASLPPGRLTLTSHERREVVKLGYMVMPTHVDLSEGEPLTDLRIKAQPCGVLAGTVKDRDGQRVSGIKVGYYCRSLRVAWGETTAADGSYRLVAPPGVVQVRVEHGEWMAMPNMHTLKVESGKTHSADFVVRRTSGVTGIVVDAAGQPVAGALLSLSASPIGTRRATREERETKDVRPLHPAATTDADGGFALKNVDAHQRASWIVQDPAHHLRDGFVFRKGMALPVRVVVKTRMGSVRGRLIDTDGKPVPKVWMNMYACRSEPGHRRRFSDGMMRSDNEGRFVYEQVMGNTEKHFYGTAKDGTAFKVPGFYVEAGQDVDFGDIVLRRPNGKPAPEIAADPIGSIDGDLSWDGALKDKVVVLVSRWGPFLRYDRPLARLAKRFEGPHFALLVLYRRELSDDKPNPLAAPDLRSVILARDRPTNPNGETHTAIRTFGADWHSHDLIVCGKRGIVRNANIRPPIDPDADSPLVQQITKLLAEDPAKPPRPTPAERRYESTIPDSASKMLKNHVGVSLRFEPRRMKPGERTQLQFRLDPSPGVQINLPRSTGSKMPPPSRLLRLRRHPGSRRTRGGPIRLDARRTAELGQGRHVPGRGPPRRSQGRRTCDRNGNIRLREPPRRMAPTDYAPPSGQCLRRARVSDGRLDRRDRRNNVPLLCRAVET